MGFSFHLSGHVSHLAWCMTIMNILILFTCIQRTAVNKVASLHVYSFSISAMIGGRMRYAAAAEIEAKMSAVCLYLSKWCTKNVTAGIYASDPKVAKYKYKWISLKVGVHVWLKTSHSYPTFSHSQHTYCQVLFGWWSKCYFDCCDYQTMRQFFLIIPCKKMC